MKRLSTCSRPRTSSHTFLGLGDPSAPSRYYQEDTAKSLQAFRNGKDIATTTQSPKAKTPTSKSWTEEEITYIESFHFKEEQLTRVLQTYTFATTFTDNYFIVILLH